MRKNYTYFARFPVWCLLLFSATSLRAQLSLTAIGTPATMNFNIPGSNSCSGASDPWTNNVTIPNCYTNRPTFAYSNGCNNTGALHVAGNGGETALGGRASNSTTLIVWGVRMVNNTGQTITALNIKYRGEQWNSAQSNVTNTVAFAYTVSASPITNVTSGSYTNFAALNMSNLVSQGSCGGGGSAIDGNVNAANIAACMPVNIPPGSEIMLRWYETNDACNDHMLCIDDLEVTPLNNSMGIGPLTGPVTVCPSDTGNYSTVLLPGVTYAWSALPAGASYIGGTPTGHQASINWGTTAPGTYTLTVTPTGNFCGITLSPVTLAVTVSAPIPVNITASPAVICPGRPVTLTSSSATDNSWNTTPPQTTPTISVSTPGTYILSVTGSCGVASDTIQILSENMPAVNLGNDQLVCGGAVNFVLDAQNPGSTYRWQDGSTNRVFRAIAAGTYFVEVTNVCSTVTDTVHIVSQIIPDVNLGNDTLVCENFTPFVLNAQNPGNPAYLWQDNGTTSSHTVTQPGRYYVRVTNNCGTATDTLDVVALPSPQVDLGPDLTLCPDNPATLDATYPGAVYRWQDNSAGPKFSVAQAGVYYVLVSNVCGQASDSVRVTLKPGPQVSLTDTMPGCGVTSLVLDAQNPGATYTWSTGETGRTITVTEAGNYWVEVNYCGSSASDSAKVTFDMPAGTFFAPDTFTPNGDEVNDYYRVAGIFDHVLTFHAAIYNRWGEMLYTTSDPYFRWNGECNGKPVPDGIYFAVFHIKQECSVNANAEYNTFITIVR